ncbi:tRNA (adenosine(37)-N6)-threonylcarbamoyltransferase complex ATPase subunit type 1 TsaE [Thalassotalea loyana]|uniref:tRNA threonylcarbamoyladenosine biosynthesis protein TsaE n=1 Tax=Thalassotalea loyana TaxID=280483 RepID=A0ABQ6H6X8_9GAMM|nr:tRNA (adenosine(37)-N6)-threonylcarbamoyltransferase complex ATPase subunit type 1 TsaE [Thalassotalea loyana]GLX83891.1 tRNA (adenosine(37)-N6)-threonylcarbamoyltransferase complex ATPase subunit type 1 TsaE [Thalassotalea loyana]
MNQYQATLVDEQATIALGSTLANIIKNELNHGVVAYLNGDLGAGKTTLTRGFVQGMGHSGHVKSPTYTLVEPYELTPWQVYHFDLYRLADPEELEYMGIRDYFNETSCSFIEWPERGGGMIPSADFIINLSYCGEHREVEVVAQSALGDKLVNQLKA